jgi:hypothetical protein
VESLTGSVNSRSTNPRPGAVTTNVARVANTHLFWLGMRVVIGESGSQAIAETANFGILDVDVDPDRVA